MTILTQAEAVRAARITGTPSPNDLLTIDEMRAALSSTADDGGVLNRECGPIELGSRTWQVSCYGQPVLLLPYPFNSVTSITVDGTLLGASTYDAASGAAAGVIRPAAFAAAPWVAAAVATVVVSVGSASIPANVKAAAMSLLRYWWQTEMQARSAGSQGNGAWFPPGGIPANVLALLKATPALGGFA